MVSLQLFPSAASRISSALMDDSFLKVFFNTFKERHQNFFWKKWTKYKYIYINLLNSSRHPTTPPLQIWGKKTQAPWKSIQTAMPRHRRPPWSHWYHLKAEYLPSDHRLFFFKSEGSTKSASQIHVGNGKWPMNFNMGVCIWVCPKIRGTPKWIVYSGKPH